jgi:capsular exopolysaccharide synthesis family protein
VLETLPRDDTPANEPAHLRDYWHVVLRRRWLAITVMAMTVGAAAAYIALVKPVYEARAQILIEREIPNVLDFDRNPRATESAAEDYYQTQFRLLQSRLLAQRVVERLGLENDPEFGASAVDAFQKRLRIQPIKNSQMVTVAFESLRPDLAARAANAMVEAYIQQTLEFRYRVSAEAGAWLADETTEQSKKVEEAQGALERFKQEAGLVNFEERKALVEQKLRDVGASLTVARTRRMEKAALYEQMRATSNPEELPDAIRSPLIQSLRTELATLERQGSELEAKGYLNEHPEVVRLRQQVDGTRQKIALEARRLVRAAQNEYDVAASQETSLVAGPESAKAEALDLSRRSSTYEALSRDLEASKKLSDSVMARQKQTDVSRNVKASNIHVIDPALTPVQPIRPRPLRDLALAVALGLALALVAAFFRDYLDTSVARPADVRHLGLPLLGVIPETTGRRTPLVMGGRGYEPGFEGYRVLRAALQPVARASDAAEAQVLVVTSTLAGEGKSLTSVNLALTLASADERVLIIDADLRRPALHRLLKARRTPGLSEVLTGAVGVAQAVVKVPGSRLCLISAGAAAPGNPADLLATSIFRNLLLDLRQRFDRIVIDTPPAGSIADALILAPQADGVLVVAQSGKVARTALAHLLERLSNARANVLGVVLSRARPDRHAYDYGPSFTPETYPLASRRALPAAADGRGASGRMH